MANFFDGNPETDFPGLAAYVKTHTPTQMLTDIRVSSIDPNKLIKIGDLAKIGLQDAGRLHAKALYAEGIRQLQTQPHRIASDTDLTIARCMLITCCLPDAAGEAYGIIEADDAVVPTEPALAVWVAMALFQGQQFEKVHRVLTRLEKIPTKTLAAQLQENGMEMSQVEDMRSYVRSVMGRR